MDLQVKTLKHMSLGAVFGAVALAIIGFGWGGWVTGGSATTMAKKQADAAVVAALTPICVSNFQQKQDATQLAALKSASFYQRGELIEKGGFATMIGSDKPPAGLASACAEQLLKPVS